AQLARLRRSPADVRVFEDRPLALAGEPGKPSAVPALVGADQMHAANITGKGVGVAFIDTGLFDTVGTMTDSQDTFRVRAAYDAVRNLYSLDAVLDENGHGSHVVSVTASSNYSLAGGGSRRYNGVAPDARLIVVKAFDDNGWGSYANVIRGIDWVVANREEYGIRVLNCSFGAPPRSHYWQDPLNQAIMRAWQAGIVVVASSGNTGPGAQTIRVPGNVPYVITVGAFTDNYTPDNSSDDRLTSFSSAGPTYDRFVKPEVVAPGGHVLGLMDKKSILPREHKQYVDRENAKYFTMSGTSQSAAVVTGVVALLLQAQPQLTPDDVKCRLLSSARGAINPQDQRAYSIFQQGAGMVWTPDAVAGTAVGCANVGLNVGNDLSGEQHFAGRARQLADGSFVVDGLTADGTVWDGVLQPGGGVFLQGDPWTDIAVGLAGDPWTDTFMWPTGYPWEETHLWSPGLSETMSINVWVQQQ
ncbi:MAG TPA: S8 family peptidase, partial [Vicinamibacteria bacterium]|nr:S8 family peptidase [Vicinamibacteria bacterium]